MKIQSPENLLLIQNKPFFLWAGACAFVSVSFLFLYLNLNPEWMLAIHASPIMPPMFWSLMNLGGDAWVVLLILLWVEKHPGEMTSWILKTWISGALIVHAIKLAYPMARPGSVLNIESLSLIDHPPLVSSSMPSGHALAAICCCFILGKVISTRKLSQWLLALTVCIGALVAWARVAVGAHWPSDVFAGAGLGLAVVMIAQSWERHSSWNAWFQKKSGIVLLITLHILIALHLTVPQSNFFWVQFFQLNLACLSLWRAVFLIRNYFLAQTA